MERLSYAGVQVEVLEHTDGRLQVRYEGNVIPHRHAPPRPGVLRAISGVLAPTPEMARIVKRLGNHRLSQHQLRQLADLNLDPAVEDPLTHPLDRLTLTPRTTRSLEGGCSMPGSKAFPCARAHANWESREHRAPVGPSSDAAHQPPLQAKGQTNT